MEQHYNKLRYMVGKTEQIKDLETRCVCLTRMLHSLLNATEEMEKMYLSEINTLSNNTKSAMYN